VRPMTAEYQGLGAAVWLERDGVRAFEVVGADGLPPGAVEELRAWVTNNREDVENQWVQYMKVNGWLKTKARGIYINITAYPNLDTEIFREVDLTMCPCWVEDDDVAIGHDDLVVGVGRPIREQARFKLRNLIWEGTDDGSDAEAQRL
jgi:hypothetical protein